MRISVRDSSRINAGEIHLFLTDVVMPEMNGRQPVVALSDF